MPTDKELCMSETMLWAVTFIIMKTSDSSSVNINSAMSVACDTDLLLMKRECLVTTHKS